MTLSILTVPRTKSVTFKQRSLAVSGPQLWNSLPYSNQNGEQFGWIQKQNQNLLIQISF